MVTEGSCGEVSIFKTRLRVSAIETKPEFERTSVAPVMEAEGRQKEGRRRERRVTEMRSENAAIDGASRVRASVRVISL